MKTKKLSSGKLAVLLFVCSPIISILLGLLPTKSALVVDIANTLQISLSNSQAIIDGVFRNAEPLVTGLIALCYMKDGSLKTTAIAFSLILVEELAILIYGAFSGHSSFLIAYPGASLLSLLLPVVGVYLVSSFGRWIKRDLNYPVQVVLYVLYLGASSFFI